MLNTSLSLRYARALFKIAKSLGITKKTCDDMAAIAATLESAPQLKRVLYHPAITPVEKKSVVEAVFASACDRSVIKFIGYLIDKKRVFIIAAIAQCLSKLRDEDENRSNVRVESYSSLSGETLKKIKERLAQTLGTEINLTTSVNTSLMGGMRIVLGDRVIDGTVKYHLQRLSETVSSF